jgi:hypothetical protein
MSPVYRREYVVEAAFCNALLPDVVREIDHDRLRSAADDYPEEGMVV